MRLPKTIPIYGDTSYRGPCREEATEQKDTWGRLKERYPECHKLAVHPKNEGKRNKWQATKDREEGALNRGASDIIIPFRVPFVCELKRRNHMLCSLSTDQLKYLLAAQEAGAFACIALGADAAEAALMEWLNLNKS